MSFPKKLPPLNLREMSPKVRKAFESMSKMPSVKEEELDRSLYERRRVKKQSLVSEGVATTLYLNPNTLSRLDTVLQSKRRAKEKMDLSLLVELVLQQWLDHMDQEEAGESAS